MLRAQAANRQPRLVVSKKKKATLFEAGSAVLGRISNPSIQGYLCPLCFRVFPDLAELSEEHAPPQSIGGRSICLTCRDCNSINNNTNDKQ